MTTTYGERLKKALEYRRIRQRAFAERIKEQGIRGGSYRSLANYLTDQFTPTQVWTQAAAEILGVSETWLGADEGQMLPDEVVKEGVDPNLVSCIAALERLQPSLSKTAPFSTFTHISLARDRFENTYGRTRGMGGADVKRSYAEHILIPLRTLLLYICGSDQFADVGPEKIRQALNQYLELVVLLMPAPEEASDEARKAVSNCLSQWRKKATAEADASVKDAIVQHMKANPGAELGEV